MREAISTLNELKRRCIVDEITDCWLWQGAKVKGVARLWMFDYEKDSYAVVSGPRAAVLSAGDRIPKGCRAWLTCTNKDCVNREHALVGTMAEWGAWMSEHGRLSDTPLRKARLEAAWKRKSPHRVEAAQAILAAPSDVKGVELAEQLNVDKRFVSKVRNGRSWAHLRGPNPFAGLEVRRG